MSEITDGLDYASNEVKKYDTAVVREGIYYT